MPELPEVETVLRGVAPHLRGKTVQRAVVRERRLRWRVPDGLERILRGQRIRDLTRRAKYLLFHMDDGCLMLHLGMSGSLRVLPTRRRAETHDHFDLILRDGLCLRLRDPRKFGSIHWVTGALEEHPLLLRLGPEPLDKDFSAAYLHGISRKRNVCVKNLLMNQQVVVGVGNIYASEALFAAGVHPLRKARRLSRQDCGTLIRCVKQTLRKAIRKGGTTLRDFTDAGGQPGYFEIQLKAYGREGEACVRCGKAIRRRVIGQRSSFYCSGCQR